jgi:hypothetical protein
VLVEVDHKDLRVIVKMLLMGIEAVESDDAVSSFARIGAAVAEGEQATEDEKGGLIQLPAPEEGEE